MNPRLRTATLITISALLLAAAAWWGWRLLVPPPAGPVAPSASTAGAESSGIVAPPAAREAPPAAAPGAPAAPAAPTQAAAPPAPAGEPPLAPGEIGNALAELAGSRAAAALLQTADFPRRFVATVDNLARSHAPPLLWPVTPAEGRFSTEPRDGAEVISVANGQRYAALVGLAESVDPVAAARVYQRLYPQLQQAYADLGFPGRPFHARLLEVIDLLLATPLPAEAPRVALTEVKGPIPSTRPWVRYEFVDPDLQSLSAGQKMLVRVGPIQQRRLMARLAAFRAAIVALPPAR
jgi:hypothetical protein